MSQEVNKVSSGYGETDRIAELNKIASEVSSGLHSKLQILGNVVKVEESEKLGPAAYSTDGIGVRSFEMHGYTHTWYQTSRYEGMLEGRIKTELPDEHYLLWFIKDGELYLKWVEGRWEQMQQEIRMERIDLRNRIYWDSIKQNFKKMLQRLQ